MGSRASDQEVVPMAPVKFEQALARLETIVSELEKGDLSLDDSLKIFEEGVKLSKTCLKMLDDAERKVEILIQDKDGRKRLRALSLEEDEDEPAHST
jgi:exodeoxyribonuclease VII small subunit